jgi:hypothetical protein
VHCMQFVVGKSEEHLIEMDLTGVGCERVDWTQLAQDRVQWRALGTQL